MSREQILDEIRKTLTELFGLDASQVTLSSRLRDDLDLDSIDAVDLAVRLQPLTGKRVDDKQLRAIRTVADIVDAIDAMRGQAGAP